MKPDKVIYDIIAGDYTLEMIDAIDTTHWTEDFIDVLDVLYKLKKKDKSITMEQIYKEGGQIVFLNALTAVTKIENLLDRGRI
jgi:hypothetical protein